MAGRKYPDPVVVSKAIQVVEGMKNYNFRVQVGILREAVRMVYQEQEAKGKNA